MNISLKKFIALALALVMCMSITTTAFASETSNNAIPENATRHEIHLTLEPEASTDENGGAQTYIWGNPGMNLIDHHTASTASFTVTDRYFAYEMNAIIYDGSTTTQPYSVALKYVNAGIIANMSGIADGTNYKLDWIDLDLDGDYYFQVTNDTDYILSVDIIYYSWN